MKKLLCFFLLLALTLPLLCPIAAAAADTGLTFTDDLYRTDSIVTQPICTYEAWLRFPTSMGSTRGGAIFGCSINDYDTAHTVDFEVLAGGTPRLLWKTADRANTRDLNFSQVKLYTGKKLHLAITFNNQTGEAKCYVDGELRQTIKTDPITTLIPRVPYGIGGTPYSGNPFYFRGELFSVAAYSDCRTAEEIKADMLLPDTDDPALVFFYELDDVTAGEPLLDQSKNRYDASLIDMWMTEEQMQQYREEAGYADYAFSIAVIGDTQTISNHFPDQLHYIYDWIVENADSKKIGFVQGLGDMTDLSEAREYELVTAQLEKLDGVVPYAFVRGNHDTTDTFKQSFPYKYYGGSPEQSFDGTMLNTYRTIRLGSVDFLMLCLDYAPTDAALSWANDVIKAHPEHSVIISTHGYLSDKGIPLGNEMGIPAGTNNGQQIWDKLISKHRNISLVLSGHITWDEILIAQTKSTRGNTVTQMLIDPQGTDGTLKGRMADGLVGGLVAMLYFSEDGTQVAVEYVSTARGQYYMSSNLQSTTLDIYNPAKERAQDFSNSLKQTLSREITQENYLARKEIVQSLRAEYQAMPEKTKAFVSEEALALLSAAEQTIAALEAPQDVPSEEQTPDTDSEAGAPSILPIVIAIGAGAAVIVAVVLIVLQKKKK